MLSSFQLTFVFILIWFSCYGEFHTDSIKKIFEYGKHVEGEQLSFIYHGAIPIFTPNYRLNVTTDYKELQNEFTYLAVIYYNLVSNVNITYIPASAELIFYIKFPFVTTPIGVVGYAMPLLPEEINITSQKYKACKYC